MPGQLLIIVDDDKNFAAALKRSFERRGYEVCVAAALEEIAPALAGRSPAYAVVDLKLATGSGLLCVEQLKRDHPAAVIVVLTGFASIATAVEAIKLGANQYLVKPSNTDDIERAFAKTTGDAEMTVAAAPTNIKTAEWERIHETLLNTDFNISEAARRLGMHRRTLARKLEKRRMK